MASIGPNRTDSLLPGETVDSSDPEVVLCWIAAYQELLRTVPALAPGDDGHGLPREHARRWQGRLDFWNQRLRS